MPSEETDALLLSRVGRADAGAWERLVQRHGRMVYTLAIRLLGNPNDAEDAFQETFVRLRTSAGTFHTGQDATGWIATMASRIALKMLERKKRLHLASSPVPAGGCLQHRPEPAHEETAGPERREEYTLLKSAVDRLPEEVRIPIVLRFAGGLNLDQIAAELHLDRSTIAYRLQGGLKRLRAALSTPSPHCVLPLSAALLADPAPPQLLAHLARQDTGPAPTSKPERPQEGSARPAAISGTWLVSLALLGAAAAWALLPSVELAHGPPPVPVGPDVPRAAPTPTVVSASPPPSASLSPRSSPAPQSPLRFDWDLRTGLPPGAVLDCGPHLPCRIDSTPTGGWIVPQNRPRTGSTANLLLPVRWPPGPLLIRVRVRPAESRGTWLLKACRAQERTSTAYQAWWRDNLRYLPAGPGEQLWVECYFWGLLSVQRCRGQVMALRRFDRASPEDRPVLFARNLVLERIEIRQIEMRDIPPNLLDFERLAGHLAASPDAAHEIVDGGPLNRQADP